MLMWLTPPVAVVLMAIGILPSLIVVYALAEEWRKPGVLWFIVSMLTGGLWALLYTLMVGIRSPEITLLLANFFWPVVTTAAVSLFFLAYEFVFKQTVSRRTVGILFAPVVLLFVLSWPNPGNIVFGAEYYVDANGFLQFSVLGDPLRVLVVQVYGYLLVFLAAGLFVGEIMRSDGLQRRQTGYLLVVFSVLVLSSLVKVGELVPIYYDPTSTVYAFSGLLFAYSIERNGLLQYHPVARQSAVEEIDDVFVVADTNGAVIDANRAARELFGSGILTQSVDELLPKHTETRAEGTVPIRRAADGDRRFFSINRSSIRYGRDGAGTIYILTDVTDLSERERELNLLKEIFSRVFRHNVRNDLTVINGYTELIEDDSADGERVAELSVSIRRKSAHLLGQAKKAHQISDVISEERRVLGSIRHAVDDAIDAVDALALRADYDIHVSVVDAHVKYHPQFHLALTELLENAVVHHTGGDQPAIEITAEVTEDCVRVTVADDGEGIPRSEIDVLEAQAETDLEHSSGIGLWLVRYIVKQSQGQLSASTSSEGTQITIELPNVTDSTND